jgi:hypothetical protein
MSVSFDVFVGAFLEKITERDLLALAPQERDETVLGYMKRAISGFKKNCRYDLTTTRDDENRIFDVEIDGEDLDEVADIVSEGMIVQWLKPYVYRQELLENAINTRDFTTYSPAELLMRVGNAYAAAQKDYRQMVREYSFNTGDLGGLHL